MFKHQFSYNRQINIPYLLKIGNGKIIKIGKYLFDKEMYDIAVFWGEGIKEIIGQDFYLGINDCKINILYEKVVDCVAWEEVSETAFNLSPKTTAILGIGGGKALDFAKYCAYLLKIPYISVPTSAANDGFCSPSASLTFQGNRKSVKSAIPYGVVVDLDIINRNPDIFLYAGVGDMVSKISALFDWKQASLKGFERYNDFAAMLSYNSLDLLFLRHSDNIRSPQFQRSLINSLLYSGIAMEIAGTSRPASGSEHLISHALDKIALHPAMHGLQVGVASYLCARLQNNPESSKLKDMLESSGFFAFIKNKPLDKCDFIKALELAPKIKNDYYTILSEQNAFENALDLINTDEVLQDLIV
ncbi:MAG: iron-containing alcohol dehydrogenase family protein [Alphaproteobacteria bacterium]|nr:iron-containing alcohol dehydrogenase family protein [Alphaproteobacteria bacterium]MBR1649469.1 iron-containing alcohol dehydrogenase family protein [Alphaproteobacteria bacterium]